MISKFLEDEVLVGLLALSPFYLVTTSHLTGLYIGGLVSVLIFISILVLYSLRSYISVSLRLVSILIISTTILIMVELIISAKAYTVAEQVGVLFPLLMMNTLVLSINEKVFLCSGMKPIFISASIVSITVLLFFFMVGLSRDFLAHYSIINSPAACFILTGFLFAGINFIKYRFIKV